MKEKTTIRRWKKPIIRWALKELKPLLPALYQCNYEVLASFGIADMTENLGIYLD